MWQDCNRWMLSSWYLTYYKWTQMLLSEWMGKEPTQAEGGQQGKKELQNRTCCLLCSSSLTKMPRKDASVLFL